MNFGSTYICVHFWDTSKLYRNFYQLWVSIFSASILQGTNKIVCQDNTDIDRAERILNEVWGGGILGKEMTTLKDQLYWKGTGHHVFFPLEKQHVLFINHLGGGFKYFFMFTPKIVEDFQFDWYFSSRLKPPPSLLPLRKKTCFVHQSLALLDMVLAPICVNRYNHLSSFLRIWKRVIVY